MVKVLSCFLFVCVFFALVVVLPVGTFMLEVTVFDNDGGLTRTSLLNQCNIEIISNSTCWNVSQLINDYFDNYQVISSNVQYLYVLQTLQTILEYLEQITYINSHCWTSLFVQVLGSMSQHFGSGNININLCQTPYVVVCAS